MAGYRAIASVALLLALPMATVVAQAGFVAGSEQRQLAQAAALLALHDGNQVISVMDSAPDPDAEIAACGDNPRPILGEQASRSDSFRSGAWSPRNGLFDLLVYRDAYVARWARLKREEAFLHATGALWRTVMIDCLQLPGIHQTCMSVVQRRLDKLGAGMPDRLPTGAQRAPLTPRMKQVICTFAAGLKARARH